MKKTFTMQLESTTVEEARHRALESGASLAQYVDDALRIHLDLEPVPHGKPGRPWKSGAPDAVRHATPCATCELLEKCALEVDVEKGCEDHTNRRTT